MSSNLTGTFIANTYQKLLQVDTDNGSVGSTAPFSATNAKTTSKHNILNGLGQSVGGLVIDQTGVSGFNGGLYLKNTTSGANNDSKASWTLQTSSDGGFNISRGSEDNYKLFLKQSGSVWVGYDDSNVPASDISGYSLYVRNGIQVGQNTTGNNGRVNLIGANPLENGAGMFINGEHPFRIYRYQVNASYIDDTQRFLEDENGQKFSTLEWTALVVGQQIIDFDGTVNSQIGLGITLRPDPSGYWEAYLYASNGDSSADTKLWIWDVMMIKKGFYQDRRLITLMPINLT